MSGRNIFNFKRFTIEQEGCAMKVGTDGVLLGAWCRIDPLQDKAILDIGTGTGVIVLQLAQRTEYDESHNESANRPIIDAVEIDGPSCRKAQENFNRSPWSDRLRVYNYDIQYFTERRTSGIKYDNIVSNPPYFVGSLTSPDASRNLARHAKSLSYDDLMKCCFRLLKSTGRISLIIPAGAETEKMIAAAATHDFVVSRRTDVHSTPKSGPKRTLLEFVRLPQAQTQTQTQAPEHPYHTPEHTSLTIAGTTPGTFSAEYRALTRDFYLYL